MSSWRDRAKPVEQQPAKSGGWRDRAKAVEEPEKEEYYNPVEKLGMGALETVAPILKPVGEAIEKYADRPLRRFVHSYDDYVEEKNRPYKELVEEIQAEMPMPDSVMERFAHGTRVGEEIRKRAKERGIKIPVRGGPDDGATWHALKEAWAEVGRDPEQSPDLPTFAEKMELSDKPLSERFPSLYSEDPAEYSKWFKWKKGGLLDVSPKSVAEFGEEAVLSPTILTGPAAKGATTALKGATTAAKAGKYGQLATKTAQYGTKATTAFANKARAVGGFLKRAPGKVGTAMASQGTGIPRKVIETFADRSDEVAELVAKYGDNADDAFRLIEDTRSKFRNQISTYRRSLGRELDDALSQSKRTFDSKGILDEMAEVKKYLDPDLEADTIAAIDDLVNRISVKGNAMSALDLNNTKRFLQKLAKGTYSPEAGKKIFAHGDDVAQAAKRGAGKAREMLEAVDDVTDINKKLSRMHEIEDFMNSNMLKKNAPPNSLFKAGEHATLRDYKTLQMLDEVIPDANMLKDAELLSAYKHFGNPSVLTMDSFTKAARTAATQGLITFAGGVPAAIIASPFTSPAVLKQSLRANKFLGRAIKRVTKLNPTGPLVHKALQNPTTSAQVIRLANMMAQEAAGEE